MNEQTLQKSVDPVEMDPAEDLPVAKEPEDAPKRRTKSKRTTAKSAPKGDSEPGAEPGEGEQPTPREPLLETPGESGDPLEPTVPADTPADPSDPQELGQLREELNQLREEIRSARRSLAEEEAELEEFRELWPEVSLTTLPDSVLEDVRRGVPLTAAYALMERRAQRLAKIAEAANAANRERSSGSAEGECTGFLSISEVRAMTPEQVRKQYRQILLSMPKWH